MKIEGKADVHVSFIRTGAFLEMTILNSFKIKFPDTIVEGNLDYNLARNYTNRSTSSWLFKCGFRRLGSYVTPGL